MVVMEENWIVGIPYKKYNKQRAVLTSSDLKLLNCLLASSLAAYTQHILLAYSCHLSGFFFVNLTSDHSIMQKFTIFFGLLSLHCQYCSTYKKIINLTY